MSETEGTQATQEAPEVNEENRDFRGVLKALAGKKLTVVNPESYEARPAGGSELRENYYPGKIVGLGEDYMIFQTVLQVSKKDRQSVQQYIPIARVKRISAMRTGTLIHI